MLFCLHCGRLESNSGKPFTEDTLSQHIRDAHQQGKKAKSCEPRFALTDMIACEDTPDGAYFALAWELGEL